INGTGGLSAQEWLTAHFRGVLFRLGRLLYERQSIWFDADGPRRGEYSLGIHIPRGRLTPQSCDESFALARSFFARHFPEEQPCRYATCVSWVLDPQLASYLSPESNIIRFQRRFTILPLESERAGDRETVEAIFASPFRDIEQLPRTTSLERAVTTHLQNGGHWYFRTGWLRLEP
ncbi:MAG TPA: hypothetical protein VHC49_11505, partial [Mycobacteriales bacterium]|nr:hypothetical protein [Mycobacteriales bacterium]